MCPMTLDSEQKKPERESEDTLKELGLESLIDPNLPLTPAVWEKALEAVQNAEELLDRLESQADATIKQIDSLLAQYDTSEASAADKEDATKDEIN
ncbi:hypothetical protein MP638_005208 [Amoeboaphelidium occidentale]|nr:hypothetical protein MP638_005208 [Amoeboaphelidium occidentale]